MSEDIDFIPKNDAARLAVENARRIVQKNNEMINKLKEEANIEVDRPDTLSEISTFFLEDSNVFDLYKIKSNNGVRDIIRDIFGAF